MTNEKDRDLSHAGQYIDDLYRAFTAQYGDVREKALAVINRREAIVRAEAVKAERERCVNVIRSLKNDLHTEAWMDALSAAELAILSDDQEATVCTWSYDEHSLWYFASCGASYMVLSRICPGCGKPVKEEGRG